VKRLENAPFALIGVNSDSDKELIKTRNEKHGITWRSFWNGPEGPSGPIATQYRVRGWPTIYVLDAQGVIRYIGVRGEAMDHAVDTLLKELESQRK
jgi:hypothetical protein